MRVSAPIDFSATEVAEYIFSPDVVSTWLGSQSRIRTRLYSSASLMQVDLNHDKKPEEGKVVSLLWPARGGNPIPAGTYQITISIPKYHRCSQVTIRISPRPSGGCRIRIEQDLIPVMIVKSYALLWQEILNNVQHLLLEAHNEFRRDRQAVILVHGIGEQRPGHMLREFMHNIFSKDTGEFYYIKPDYVSSLFEMRMATVPRGNSLRPATDVYELYWAHLIRDTTLPQVCSWLLRLIFSKKSSIPETLRNLVDLTRITFIAVFFLILIPIFFNIPAIAIGVGGCVLFIFTTALPVVLKGFGDYYLVNYAGDGARYLEPRAYNISRRQEIREAGVKLINALHEKDRYSRIIVYGHSLGSVIAYDILSLAWARRSRIHKSTVSKATPHISSRKIMALENLLDRIRSKRVEIDLNKVQEAQHKAWLEYRRNGFNWLISDFVTAGSPLAHAQWLFNLDAENTFNDLVIERTFPTCPPQAESGSMLATNLHPRSVFTFTHSFKDMNSENGKKRLSVQIPHHGGLFAITRWTNLFFPCSRLGLRGDPIGGPLSSVFGSWIKDISLVQASRTFAHSLYVKRSVEPRAVQNLRMALRLDRSLAYYASSSKPVD